MLKIKHPHFPSLSSFSTQSRTVAFSPVVSEDDELIQAIENDYVTHGNDWELSPTPDVYELEQFWSEVQQDVAHDPEWFHFD